jgi:hypothetical protein
VTEEEAEQIINQQCPSTQKAMRRPISEDAVWHAREFRNWKAVENAKTMEEAVGARTLSFSEVKIEQNLRHNRGMVLAQIRNEGPVSSVSPEKRERAINAFMLVKTRFKDLMKSWGLASTKEVQWYERHEK